MRLALSTVLLLFCAYASAQKQQFRISTTHLTDNVYVHTSYGLPDGKTPYPANGLFIVTNAGIILIDTPWDEDQTQQLIDSLKTHYKKKIVLCIATHFHSDRTAGLDVLKKNGVKTYTSKLTAALAKQKSEKQPEFTFSNDTVFTLGNTTVQTYYPGEGHTKDNIVIWLPQSRVLFGGCLIKSLDVNDPGYTGDADIKNWPLAIACVKDRFKNIKYIIPGHEGWKGDTLMFTHTIKIVRQK